MSDEVSKLKLQVESLYKNDLEYKLQQEYVKKNLDMFRTILMDCVKRIQALEHPNMDEPLKAFQKLRTSLQKVEEANL
jgi:hypothetical protein